MITLCHHAAKLEGLLSVLQRLISFEIWFSAFFQWVFSVFKYDFKNHCCPLGHISKTLFAQRVISPSCLPTILPSSMFAIKQPCVLCVQVKMVNFAATKNSFWQRSHMSQKWFLNWVPYVTTICLKPFLALNFYSRKQNDKAGICSSLNPYLTRFIG